MGKEIIYQQLLTDFTLNISFSGKLFIEEYFHGR